jgi:transposase
MTKKYINESAWSKIFNFFKTLKNIYTGNETKLKQFTEGLFWISRTGAQWRELPNVYGKWNSIFKKFNEWAKKDIWSKLLAFCANDPDMENVMIDSTIVRAHACAAGYGDQEIEGLGRSKGGFTSKIHAMVDGLGNLLKIIITPGQHHDITQAIPLLEGIKDANVLADRGYISSLVREHIINKNSIPVIPSKSNSKSPIDYDKHLYKERHLVECFFSKLKHFRRVFSRYDKSARNFASFVSFVGAILWLR